MAYFKNIDRWGNEILNGGGAPDFNPTPVNYTPAASGNTQNLNSFVIDPNGDLYFIDEDGESFKINTSNPLDVLTSVQPTPSSTGNTTNLNTVFKDANGDTWVVDYKGDAIKAGTSAFKNLNEFHVDPNGNDTTGDGSQEKPFATIGKAVSVAGQGDQIVVHAGVYTENVVLSTPNVALVGAQSEYGSLTQINGSISVTASGTSVKISDINATSLSDTGTGDLYLNSVTITSTLSSSAGYLEIRNSSIQDGTITKSGGNMLIENSKIDNVNVSGTNTAAIIRDSYQDGNSTINYATGTIYSINNVVGGEVVIDSSAVPLETAALAQGLSAEMAKEAETNDFMKLGLLRPDTEASPTKVVTWDETTKRLEVSDLSAVSGDKYKTTSTTCQDIVSTGNITLTVATGLAYTPLQDIIVYADANNHMHGQVVSYNSATGVLVMEVHQKTGSGNFCNWTVNLDAIKLNEVSVYFGTQTPTAAGQVGIEGDFYYVTSDGTYSGTITETWVYDSVGGWVKIPMSSPELVQFGSAAPTSTTGYTAGDEYFVTSNGTSSGTITAEYIFNGTSWTLRPSAAAASTALWFDVTTNPTATGNTGTLPRFTNNTVTGDRFYVDSTGKAYRIEKAAVGLTPDLSPVKDFKTQAQIDALAVAAIPPNHGDSYIVTDGTNKGNIARWDSTANNEAGGWEYYVPADLDVTTVTNPDNETFQGKWRYDIVGDYWVQISEGIVIPDPVERPVNAENTAFGRTSMLMTHSWSTGWSYAFIQNDQVALWGNSTIFINGTTGSNSDASFPRKLSWNWYNGSGSSVAYSPVGQYVPKFVDVVHTDQVMIAIDHLGKVWAMGNQTEGTGLTTTPTSTVAQARPPYFGLEPIPFFQGLTNVFASKCYANNNKYAPPIHNTAIVTTDGDLYVAGNNAWGQLGRGNQTAYAAWSKVTQLSNVIDVKMQEYTIMALQADGKLYIWGHSTLQTGAGVAYTTPQLIASGVAQFDFHSDANGANVLGIMVVKTDGTVWGIGNNASGQLGIGNTTNTTTFKQAVGVNNAKNVFCSRGVGAAVITGLIRTDGTVSFCGRNQEGQFGYTVATAAATYTTFVTPAFSAQGTIIEGMIGRSTTLRTASGDIWNAGLWTYRGLGDGSGGNNSWTNNNIFQKVPLPEPALAMRGNQSTNAAGNHDNTYILTGNHGILVYGGNYPGYISLNHQQWIYSPYSVDFVRVLNNGITISDPLGGKYDKAATITGITAGSISDVIDGSSNQYIKVNLTINGTAGKLDTSGATLTGANLTAVNQTTYVYETGTTGNQITLVFKVNATDLIPVGGAAQTQNWVVSLGGFTYNLSSSRYNDIIAEKLTTSLTAYNSANVGDYIPVTLAEWSALSVISGAATAGKIDASTAYTTNSAWVDLGIVFSARTSATNSAVTLPVPANRYVYAFQVKTGTAQTNQTYALGVLPAQGTTGLELIGQNGATGITNTVGEFKAFVIKGGKLVTQSSDIAVWGGSFANKANSTAPLGSLSNYTGGTGANSAPLTTTSVPTVWGNSPWIQALHEATGNFVK